MSPHSTPLERLPTESFTHDQKRCSVPSRGPPLPHRPVGGTNSAQRVKHALSNEEPCEIAGTPRMNESRASSRSASAAATDAGALKFTRPAWDPVDSPAPLVTLEREVIYGTPSAKAASGTVESSCVRNEKIEGIMPESDDYNTLPKVRWARWYNWWLHHHACRAGALKRKISPPVSCRHKSYLPR